MRAYRMLATIPSLTFPLAILCIPLNINTTDNLSHIQHDLHAYTSRDISHTAWPPCIHIPWHLTYSMTSMHTHHVTSHIQHDLHAHTRYSSRDISLYIKQMWSSKQNKQEWKKLALNLVVINSYLFRDLERIHRSCQYLNFSGCYNLSEWQNNFK